MNLTFIKSNDRWEAEIKVTADFNLHIEGLPEGNVSVFMRGTESGEYAYVRGATPYPSVGTVYEYDFSAVIFPKYIKIACATQPSLAVVTSAGEVIQINNAPVEPSEPEVLTYTFDCRDVPWEEEDMWSTSKTIRGDFSELYDSLIEFTKTHGEFYSDEGVYRIGGYGSIVPLSNPKVTALADENTTYNLCWIEVYPEYSTPLNIGFDVPHSPNNPGGECFLSRTTFILEKAIGY